MFMRLREISAVIADRAYMINANILYNLKRNTDKLKTKRRLRKWSFIPTFIFKLEMGIVITELQGQRKSEKP